MRKYIFLCLFLLIKVLHLFAGDTIKYSSSFKVGPLFKTNNRLFTNGQYGLSFGVNAIRSFNNVIVGLRFNYSQCEISSKDIFVNIPTENVINADIFTGFNYEINKFLVQISSGVSYLKGNKRGTYHSGGNNGSWGLGFSFERYDNILFDDFGVPIDINVSYIIDRRSLFWGLYYYANWGLGYYANINNQYPFQMPYVNLHIKFYKGMLNE